jgi:hypothetical protein
VWLAAIDVRKLPGRSVERPVWLPFQDPRSQEPAAATWVERLRVAPQSPCGDGAVCAAGQCVPAQN